MTEQPNTDSTDDKTRKLAEAMRVLHLDSARQHIRVVRTIEKLFELAPVSIEKRK